MTKSQTYQTRHLTARDHQLIDALEQDPRYAKIAEVLRPKGGKPVPKPVPKAAPPEPEPPPEPPEPGHPVSAMTSKDAPSLGRRGR